VGRPYHFSIVLSMRARLEELEYPMLKAVHKHKEAMILRTMMLR
jgi:hypothetical protein